MVIVFQKRRGLSAAEVQALIDASGGGGAVSAIATYVESSTASSGSTTSLAVNTPTGVIDNDVMVTIISASPNTSTITPPAGWNIVAGATQDFGTADRMSVYTKRASSEGATYTWQWAPFVGVSIIVIALRNIVTEAPEAEDSQVNASSTSATAPSITTLGANRILIAAWASDNFRTITSPGTMDSRQASASAQTLTVATQLIAVAGATGTRVGTVSSANANMGWLGAFA